MAVTKQADRKMEDGRWEMADGRAGTSDNEPERDGTEKRDLKGA
jgi:hypothetical protein